MKKNIVLLIPSLRRGGAERVVSRLSTILKSEYNISVVIFDSTQIDYECDAPIIDLDEKATSSNLFIKFTKVIKRAYKYYKFKKHNKVDTTYSFGNTANFTNVFSFGKDYKITSIRGFGNLSLDRRATINKLYKILLKLTLAKSDRIVSVSKGIKDSLIHKFGINENKVDVIYNGYDVQEIQQSCVNNESNPMHFNFVSMGTYRKEKNYPRLLAAFSEVAKKYSYVKLKILGEGSKFEKNKIKEIIARNKLNEKVELVGFKANPYELISACDCYVLSSISEGFPNALVEAMACGLPVIATDCDTGPKEILSDEAVLKEKTRDVEYAEFGILVSPRHEDKSELDPLVQAMMEVIENTELRQRYSNNAVERASYFSYDQWRKEHIKLLG